VDDDRARHRPLGDAVARYAAARRQNARLPDLGESTVARKVDGAALSGDSARRGPASCNARWSGLWSSNYIQHSAHIPSGRDSLFNLIRSTPATLKYAPGVVVPGRFSRTGTPRNWIAADVVRVTDGVLVEYWDVPQDEATEAESQSALPMFGTGFRVERS
jgi:predicted SnoaL-like aldol condensation-catalyzing enzyme